MPALEPVPASTLLVPSPDSGALAGVGTAGQLAIALLADPAEPRLGVVTCLSVHLAALDRALGSARGAVDHELTAGWRRGREETHLVLRHLERLYSGDSTAAPEDPATIDGLLTRTLDAQLTSDTNVLGVLQERLSAPARVRFVEAYEQAIESGPTRPHPHTPHGRLLAGLAFRVNRLRDHAMDAMDSRPNPVHRRAPVAN